MNEENKLIHEEIEKILQPLKDQIHIAVDALEFYAKKNFDNGKKAKAAILKIIKNVKEQTSMH